SSGLVCPAGAPAGVGSLYPSPDAPGEGTEAVPAPLATRPRQTASAVRSILGTTRSAFQACRKRDLDVTLERLRDGAILLRLLGRGHERLLVETRTSADDIQVHGRQSGPGDERRRRLDVESVGRCALLSEAVRQGHREAGGVRRGDQLLRARPAALVGLRT